jgi:hypothetical protein
MSIEQGIAEIQRMSGSDLERVSVEVARREESWAFDEAARRAAELDSGRVQPLSHDDFFDLLKKRFGCL